MRNKNFFFFGDSICVGQGVSLSQGWVTRIAQELDAYNKRNNDAILVINASRNGDTTRQALERMPYDVQCHGIDFIIIQFGLNDCNYWDSDRGLPRVSFDSFKSNLIEIVQRSRNFGASKIILNTNHPTKVDHIKKFTHHLSYEENNRKYNDGIRQVVDYFNSDDVVLIDIEKIFLEYILNNNIELGELLLHDGLHLSLAGHQLYYPNILNKINYFLS